MIPGSLKRLPGIVLSCGLFVNVISCAVVSNTTIGQKISGVVYFPMNIMGHCRQALWRIKKGIQKC